MVQPHGVLTMEPMDQFERAVFGRYDLNSAKSIRDQADFVRSGFLLFFTFFFTNRSHSVDCLSVQMMPLKDTTLAGVAVWILRPASRMLAANVNRKRAAASKPDANLRRRPSAACSSCLPCVSWDRRPARRAASRRATRFLRDVEGGVGAPALRGPYEQAHAPVAPHRAVRCLLLSPAVVVPCLTVLNHDICRAVGSTI